MRMGVVEMQDGSYEVSFQEGGRKSWHWPAFSVPFRSGRHQLDPADWIGRKRECDIKNSKYSARSTVVGISRKCSMHTKETLERFVTDIPTPTQAQQVAGTSHRHRHTPCTIPKGRPQARRLPRRFVVAARRFTCRCIELRGPVLAQRPTFGGPTSCPMGHVRPDPPGDPLEYASRRAVFRVQPFALPLAHSRLHPSPSP